MDTSTDAVANNVNVMDCSRLGMTAGLWECSACFDLWPERLAAIAIPLCILFSASGYTVNLLNSRYIKVILHRARVTADQT